MLNIDLISDKRRLLKQKFRFTDTIKEAKLFEKNYGIIDKTFVNEMVTEFLTNKQSKLQ